MDHTVYIHCLQTVWSLWITLCIFIVSRQSGVYGSHCVYSLSPDSLEFMDPTVYIRCLQTVWSLWIALCIFVVSRQSGVYESHCVYSLSPDSLECNTIETTLLLSPGIQITRYKK